MEWYMRHIAIHLDIHNFRPLDAKSSFASLICRWTSSAASGQSLNVNVRYKTMNIE